MKFENIKVFNFEGAYRYELFEEYYPEKFEQLRKYIEDGKWNVTGSSYENGDVNVVSIVVLIGIAVLLAIIFRGAITNLLNTLFGTIENNATKAIS